MSWPWKQQCMWNSTFPCTCRLIFVSNVLAIIDFVMRSPLFSPPSLVAVITWLGDLVGITQWINDITTTRQLASFFNKEWAGGPVMLEFATWISFPSHMCLVATQARERNKEGVRERGGGGGMSIFTFSTNIVLTYNIYLHYIACKAFSGRIVSYLKAFD